MKKIFGSVITIRSQFAMVVFAPKMTVLLNILIIPMYQI
jgi:hypothetical protein